MVQKLVAVLNPTTTTIMENRDTMGFPDARECRGWMGCQEWLNDHLVNTVALNVSQDSGTALPMSTRPANRGNMVKATAAAKLSLLDMAIYI